MTQLLASWSNKYVAKRGGGQAALTLRENIAATPADAPDILLLHAQEIGGACGSHPPPWAGKPAQLTPRCCAACGNKAA